MIKQKKKTNKYYKKRKIFTFQFKIKKEKRICNQIKYILNQMTQIIKTLKKQYKLKFNNQNNLKN